MNYTDALEIEGVHYGLSLYYSYLLPLFEVYVEEDRLIVFKKHGVCKGLKCVQRNGGSVQCFIPHGCGESVYEEILGLSKRNLFSKLLGDSKTSYLTRFTLMYSPMDRLYVSSTIYLSRSTDYYVNTVRWVREAIELNCFDDPAKCIDIARSYQFVVFIKNLPNLNNVLSKGYSNVIDETVWLMGIKGFGVKSAFAYLLHAYGLTNYAPIDRHYMRLLKSNGVYGKTYSKTICVASRLDCLRCVKGDFCIYRLTQRFFGEFNGVVQSLVYVYGRLVKKAKFGVKGLEALLLRGVDLNGLIREVNAFLNTSLKESVKI